jgi:hypothetical protein
MAVIQISKIQVRRGLQENLPQLASGEMGWSVDERRLWIGNGTLVEGAPETGNTEILTSARDYSSFLTQIRSVFQGIESGYVSRTGPSAAAEVRRSLQNKLDEQISFRDFITPEEAETGDYTASLQRAIDQIFPINYYSTVGVRRVLHIPAGVYSIIGNITIPPYASIRGDGPRSTIIKKTFGTDSVIRLRDSGGLVGTSVDPVTNDKPFEITFSGLTLQSDVDTNVALLESCQYVKFDAVRFQGAVTSPSTVGDGTAAVAIKDIADTVNKVSFNQCEFVRTSYGIAIEGDVSSVTVNDSLFDTVYQGLVSSANVASPQSIKITSSQFDNVTAEAIFSDDDSSVTSAFNYYRTVGISAGTPVLTWNTTNNYSIGDVFDRSVAEQLVDPIIVVADDTAASLTQASTVGTVQDTPGGSVTLDDATTANTTFALTAITSSAIVDYKIIRGDHKRIGTIKVSHFDGADVAVDDEYTESADIGVTLAFTGNIDSSSAVLGYTTTSTGTDATFKYTVRSFI